MKFIITAILLVIATTSYASKMQWAVPDTPCPDADVDSSGAVDVIDVIRAINIAQGKCIFAGDVNHDGKCDGSDAAAAMNAIFGCAELGILWLWSDYHSWAWFTATANEDTQYLGKGWWIYSDGNCATVTANALGGGAVNVSVSGATRVFSAVGVPPLYVRDIEDVPGYGCYVEVWW